MEKLIADHKVFVVEKPSICRFCVTAKKVLNTYDIPDDFIQFMNIEGDPNMSDIQDYMNVKTGARTVPRVFIDGKCIGGGNETESMHQRGELKALLKAAGAIV